MSSTSVSWKFMAAAACVASKCEEERLNFCAFCTAACRPQFMTISWICEERSSEYNCTEQSHDDELRHEAETQAVATTIVKKGDFVVY